MLTNKLPCHECLVYPICLQKTRHTHDVYSCYDRHIQNSYVLRRMRMTCSLLNKYTNENKYKHEAPTTQGLRYFEYKVLKEYFGIAEDIE